MVPVPVHVDVAPVPDKVQVTGFPVEEDTTGRSTVPVGGVGLVEEVSVTMAVQEIGSFATTVEGLHTTLIVVGCRLATVSCRLAELTACEESPS